MAIKYYPNRIFKKVKPSIDNILAVQDPKVVSGYQDFSVGDLDETVSSNGNWKVNVIALDFSNVASKTYSASVKNGRKVVVNLNDYLWFQITGSMPQQITLSTGFYTGTELAAELKIQLDANTVFTAANVTFTVAYAPATGLYTITPSSGEVRYLDVNVMQTLRTRDSIAGHLFGYNADTSFAASIASDTPVFALDSETNIFSEIAPTDLGRYNDDVRVLNVDQAIHLSGNSASDTVNWTVGYEEIV
jgi:hypothetical protein